MLVKVTSDCIIEGSRKNKGEELNVKDEIAEKLIAKNCVEKTEKKENKKVVKRGRKKK